MADPDDIQNKEKPKLPQRSRRQSTWDETPSRIDRKSLSGMSDSVKAILAPLLGGTKRHSEVMVDLGSDPAELALYDSVPTGTTAMHRYSTIEHTVATEAATTSSEAAAAAAAAATTSEADPGASSSSEPDTTSNPPNQRSSPETLNAEANASVMKIITSGDDTEASVADPSSKTRPSYTSRSSVALQNMQRSSPEKDREASPKVTYPRASRFPRKSLVPTRRSTSKGKGVYGEASDAPPVRRSLADKVKDAVTGQSPSKGISSGRATRESAAASELHPELLPGAVRDTLPVQDVGFGGRFSRDAASVPERHTNGPNEPASSK